MMPCKLIGKFWQNKLPIACKGLCYITVGNIQHKQRKQVLCIHNQKATLGNSSSNNMALDGIFSAVQKPASNPRQRIR